MFDWLFEGKFAVKALLIFVVGVLIYLGVRLPNRRLLMGAAVFAVLVFFYFLLDVLVETDSEQIERKMTEIGKSLNKPDTTAAMQHLSEKFDYLGLNREKMRTQAEEVLRKYQIRNLRIWDLEVRELDRAKGTAKLTFLLKSDSTLTSGVEYLLCRTRWTLDPDGQWRMQTFSLHNPFVGTDEPFPLPLR